MDSYLDIPPQSPQLSETILQIVSAFGMQDYETFSSHGDIVSFLVLVPNEELMELKFQLTIKEEKLFEYWIHVYNKKFHLTTLHSWIYDVTTELDEYSEYLFHSPYGRHIAGGFYLLGIGQEFLDFLGVFTADEKAEMALRHQDLMQKLSCHET